MGSRFPDRRPDAAAPDAAASSPTGRGQAHRAQGRGRGNWFEFIVADIRIGMTPEQFGSCSRNSANPRLRPPSVTAGTGLGLAITRRLARMMGGRVQLYVLVIVSSGSARAGLSQCDTLRRQTG